MTQREGKRARAPSQITYLYNSCHRFSPEWNSIESLFRWIKHYFMPAFMASYTGPTAAADCAKAGCDALTLRQARGFFRGCGYTLPAEQNEGEEEEEEEEEIFLLMTLFLLLRNRSK